MSSPIFDAQLSARLNEVRLPDGLLSRLLMIPLASDAGVDRLLADIALPPDLTGRLSAIEPTQRATLPSVKRAAAAVAMFALGLGYIFSVTTVVYSRFDQPLLADEPLRATGFLLADLLRSEADKEEDAWLTLDAAYVELALHSTAGRSTDPDAEHPMNSPAEGPIAGRPPADERKPGDAMRLTGTPIALAEVDAPPLWPVAGGPATAASLAAALETVTETFGEWPIERSFVRVGEPTKDDPKALRQAGALPWFDAAQDAMLAVELSASDAGYTSCRRQIGSGRLPLDGRVRAEEFLAAFEYGLVDRQADTPITVVVGPSPYRFPVDTAAPDAEGGRWLVAVAIAAPSAGDTGETSGFSNPALTVRFAPERVTAYRIVGYGLAQPSDDKFWQRAAPQVAAAASERWPAFEREAVVLFEVTLPDATGLADHLGELRLAWRDAQGRLHASDALLKPRSLAERFEAAPVGWRQAALVGLAAESLAGSPFAEHVSLGEVVSLARRIEPLVDDQAGWREFIEMIGTAQSLKVMCQSVRVSPVQKFLASRVLSL